MLRPSRTAPDIFVNFNETWIFSIHFKRNPKTRRHVRPVPAELFHTDCRTDITKLTVAFALVPTRLINLHYTQRPSLYLTENAVLTLERSIGEDRIGKYLPLIATVTTNASLNCVGKMRGVNSDLHWNRHIITIVLRICVNTYLPTYIHT